MLKTKTAMNRIEIYGLNRMTFGKWILTIILAVVAAIQLYPFLWLLLVSFKDNSEIFGGNLLGLPKQFIWQNYSNALLRGKVSTFLCNSIFVTGMTIVISGILSCMVSYAIARMRWKLQKTTLTIFLLGMMVPIHSSLLPLFIILTKSKLIDTPWALIISYVGFAMPMSIYILVGFMQRLPKEMEESAFIDGASIYTTFFRIILPLIKPAIATISIFTYLSAWNELMFAVTFISKDQFKTLTVGIMQMVGQYYTDWGPIGAGLVIATLPTIVVYLLMSSHVQKSLIAGAVKG